MKKQKRFILNDPIYKATFLVQRGGTVNSAIACYAKKLKVTPWTIDRVVDGHFAAYTTHKGGVIWLGDKAGTGVITHECFHATAYVFEKLECKLTEATEEVFAYYLQWLTSEVVRRLY